MLTLYAPQADRLVLRLSDAHGKTLSTTFWDATPGTNKRPLDVLSVQKGGLYFLSLYRMRTKRSETIPLLKL